MANKTYSIDEILAQLEDKKSAESAFAEKLAAKECDDKEDKKEEPKKEEPKKEEDKKEEKPAETEKKAEESVETPTEEELAKVAEYVEQGKLMAHAFMDELMKIANALDETDVPAENCTEKIAEDESNKNNDALDILQTLYKSVF